MDSILIKHIVKTLKGYDSRIFLVENNDRFLYRSDVIAAFKLYGVEISNGSPLEQRIKYELRDGDSLLMLVSQDNGNYLEDIKRNAIRIEFGLKTHLHAFHIPTIIQHELPVLDKLFTQRQIKKLDKLETLRIIREVTQLPVNTTKQLNVSEFSEELHALLKDIPVNWSVVCRHIAYGITKTIGKPEFEPVFEDINKANAIFQDSLIMNYQQMRNSSPVKKPKIVSKILDYLNFNFSKDNIALIVIDGMAYWQYLLLCDALPLAIDEDVIYSWLPSITQLSRQAIFRGDTPLTDYRQNPVNEEKLWRNYWLNKGISDFEISYRHEDVTLKNMDAIKRLAIVMKGLDDKMHGASDYEDLIYLTKNWVKRSGIEKLVQVIQNSGFRVFITTDHGNIEAKAWRGLRGKEKLGTNKSGSRSERHIEYSEKWLMDEFLDNNPDIRDTLAMDAQAMYFKSDLSFSNKKRSVTHGGAHLLEVLIPFIEIKHES